MKIALTGGIGSGKSAVLKILKEFGEHTISFDAVYKRLLLNEDFLLGVYGAATVKPEYKNGRLYLNSSVISKKVFSDTLALKKLNAFTHEKVFAEAFKQGKVFEDNGERVFYEVPLLFEGGYQNRFDKVWVVVRDKGVRISAAAARDGLSEFEVEKRVKNQFDYENCDLSIHTIISNDGDLPSLKVKVESALNEIKNI